MTNNAEEYLTTTQVAERWGCTVDNVYAAVRRGHLEPVARNKFKITDVDAARSNMHSGRMVAHEMKKALTGNENGKSTPPKQKPKAKTQQKPATSKPSKPTSKDQSSPAATVQPTPMMDARLRLEVAKAERAELDAAERKGELVNAQAMQFEIMSMCRLIMAKLETLPQRIGPPLLAMTTPAEAMQYVHDEIRIIQDELAAMAERASGVEHADLDKWIRDEVTDSVNHLEKMIIERYDNQAAA